MDGLFPSKITGETQSAWQIGEALSELLNETADLENACRVALLSLLEASKRPAGVLFAITSGEDIPALIVQRDLPETWLTALEDVQSQLFRLMQSVLQSGEAVSSDDWLDDLAVALPVGKADGCQGVLVIQGLACTSEEVGRLSHMMPPIARAIQIGRLVRSIQERAKDLATLQTQLTHTGFTTDFEGLQAQMIRGASRILDVERSALVLLDEAHDEWIIHKSLGPDSEWVFKVSPRQGKGLVKECLRNGEVLCVNDVETDPRFDPSSDTQSGLSVRSMLCAPLMANGQVLGAIQVLNKRRGTFTGYDQDLLCMIASLAANAMRGSRVIQQLKVANADLEASRWELLGSRNTLRAIFDNLPASLYIIDQQYKLIVVNKGRAQRCGQSPQSLVGQFCHMALFNRPEPCAECRVFETLNTGQNTLRNERRWSGGDDPTEWEISSYPILGENEQIVQAILFEQDMTEKRHLEAILTQSEKLAAVGQLAAGVAHEINNPLTAIIANAQILHRELPPDSDLQESVELISRAGARAAQVVRNLLDFARKEDYSLALTDLNETMERALQLVQHELLSRSVRLESDLGSNLPSILASQDHLQSVWLNLLLNAIDALDKTPGVIKISTCRVDDAIQVSIADNGKGIPAERLTRIFEPFYTTKAPGRGTGLGLSVSHRIVKQHGGHIRVDSQLGAGSTFTVILPMT